MPIGGELNNKSLFKFGKKWGEFSKFSSSECVHSRSNSRSTKKTENSMNLKLTIENVIVWFHYVFLDRLICKKIFFERFYSSNLIKSTLLLVFISYDILWKKC